MRKWLFAFSNCFMSVCFFHIDFVEWRKEQKRNEKFLVFPLEQVFCCPFQCNLEYDSYAHHCHLLVDLIICEFAKHFNEQKWKVFFFFFCLFVCCVGNENGDNTSHQFMLTMNGVRWFWLLRKSKDALAVNLCFSFHYSLFTFRAMNRNQMLSIPQSIHITSLIVIPERGLFCKRCFILSKCVFATCHNHNDATFLLFKCLVESCCYQRRTPRKHILANHGVVCDHIWYKRTSTKCTFFKGGDVVRESDWSQRTRINFLISFRFNENWSENIKKIFDWFLLEKKQRWLSRFPRKINCEAFLNND